MDPISIAQTVYHLASLIYAQAQKVKANQQQCLLLADRVAAIEGAIKKLGTLPKSEAFCKSLTRLQHCLTAIHTYMKQLSEATWFRQFLFARSHDSTFRGFNEQLTGLIPELSLGLDAQVLINQAADQKAMQEDHRALMGQQDEILRLNQEMMQKLNKVPDQSFYERQHASIRVHLGELMKMVATMADQKSPPASPTKKDELTLDAKMVIPYYALELKERLGQGTFGKIYRGLWQDVPVAIKVWEGTLSDKEKQQFIRETQILQRLRTPTHVPQLYGACLENNQACLVMEYCPLGSLDQYLQNQALTPKQQHEVALSTAKALKFLHDNQVVHRYFKSANVLLVDTATRFQAKITGFGLSKTQYPSIVSAQLKLDELVIGLAPEVLDGKEATVAADAFSFGSVLWELLTQRKAFVGVTPQQLKDGHQEDCLSLDIDYSRLIQKCWSLDPKKRPGFQEIISALTQLQPAAEVSSPVSPAITISPPPPLMMPLPSIPTVVAGLPSPMSSSASSSSVSSPAHSPLRVPALASPRSPSPARSPSPSPATPSAYELAKKFHAEKKYEQARQQYEIVLASSESKSDYSKACTKLATLLIRGNGGNPAELKADQARAVQLFQESAAQNDVTAMQNLEQAYRHGIGVVKNEKTADDWRARYLAVAPKAAAPDKGADAAFHSMQPAQASSVNMWAERGRAAKPPTVNPATSPAARK